MTSRTSSWPSRRADATGRGADDARDVHDAVVIGAGPNGLVAANVLADAGWDVLVVEAQPVPGGAVRTASLTAPGFRDDVFSAFYPLAAASSVLRDLALHDHGLRWTHAPTVLAHPLPGAPAALLHRDIDVTAASLEVGHPGDGDAYRVVDAEFRHVAGPLLDVLLRPFPPVGPALRLGARARPAGVRDLTRLALVPLRRFLEERFGGEQAALLYAGLALHADLTPETSGSALFGWLLAGLGQQHGFPVPVGGAGSITDALVERLATVGGSVHCDTRIDRIEIACGRAVGVRTASGQVIHARRAVLADTDATSLLLDLVGPEHLPASTLHRVRRIERGAGTFKIDWALSAPVPWADHTVRGAGTVHLADSLDELTVTASELARHLVPRDPFVLLGQMTTADPTRSPAGTESVWAYTHVPQWVRGDAGAHEHPRVMGTWDDDDTERFAARLEARVERLAPGFGELVIARHLMPPPVLQSMDANLVGGDIGGGTAQLHQQLVFRPMSGLGRPETPVRGLYLASASAHPGGGVHGACGANAARAAILHHRLRHVSWGSRSGAASQSAHRVTSSPTPDLLAGIPADLPASAGSAGSAGSTAAPTDAPSAMPT